MLPYSSKGVEKTVIKRGPGSFTACICGVLAQGQNQFGPIADFLPGTKQAYHTTGKLFHADNLVRVIVADMLNAARYDTPINLVGASMGGMIAPFVVHLFRKEAPNYDLSKLRVIVVDAPAGLDSLTDPMAKFLGFGPIAQIAATAAVINLPVGDDMLPQPKEVTTATPYRRADGGWSTPEEAKQRVINIARKDLSGNPMSLFLRQTRWMIKVGSDGTLKEAVSALKGVNTTYMVCKMGKSPIKQPATVDTWKANVENLRVIEVEATHCGFLQNTPEFAQAFAQAFA